MALTEDQAAKIILIRSVEECDKSVFSERMLSDALAAASKEKPGLDWIEKRASSLFGHLSAWHQSIVQLAKAPANWTVPVCLLALIVGLGTNLLGSTQKIHVIRNPVVFLVAWNLLVYVGLLFLVLLRKSPHGGHSLTGLAAPPAQPQHDGERFKRRLGSPTKVPWPARYLVPRIWQLLHKVMFGFEQTKNLASLTSHFTAHWFSIAGSLVVARWRYLLHLASLFLAAGAAVGMYFRGLFQGYEFVWDSTFITDERPVSGFIHAVFGPSLFVSHIFSLGLAERIDIGRLLTPQGDTSDAWIHLFAITVVIAVVVPRGALALSQFTTIKKLINRFGLALDDYYGEVIEAPIRSIIEKEADTAISQFSEKVASYVGSTLYAERIVPRIQEFREKGGRIADLKEDLTQLTEAFSPQVKAFISDTAIAEFQRSLSQRVGEIVKSIGTEFINERDPEEILRDLKVLVPEGAEFGVSDQFSKAAGVSVGAAIALTFATVGGGLGHELGTAIIAALLGTTGPVGFLIGLVIGAVVAAGAWWFGKEKITEAVDNVNLPGVVVRAALWESRFGKLIEDGRKKCEESVHAKVKEQLTPLLPKITDEIIFRIRSLWGS